MLQNSALRIFSIYLLSGIFFQAAESSKSCPIFDSKPSSDAYSPINIITKNAIRVNVSTPTNLRNGVFGPLLVVNTGYAFEAYGNPAVISGGIIYGGVLCGKLYRFHKLRAYISQDPNGRSYNEIDGKGSPLTIALLYYDSTYGSFKNGLKHPGGVVQFSYLITDGPIYNPVFILPDIAIRLFRFPGTALYFGPEILLYLWFNIISVIKESYAFWGSYIDLVSGKEYPNVIQIQTAGIYPLLTKSQLTAFQSLLSVNGTKLETVAPLHPASQSIYHAGPFPKAVSETYSLF